MASIRSTCSLVVLAGFVPLLGMASEPVFPSARGERCVEPTAVMRRDHFDFLDHHGQQTVERGIRKGRHSLVGCIGCHAIRNENDEWIPISSPGQFCYSCHAYTAVQIDCFSCHSAVPDSATLVGN